jgi:DNA-binding transcriptional regulator YbjK
MYIYIEMKDLVANALIELLENGEKGEVLFKQLDEYGARVIEVLRTEEQTSAVLVVSRESQMAMVEDYSNMFELFERDGAKGIRLKEGINSLELWNRFCASLSLKIIRAFQSEKTKAVLGVSYGK